MAYELAEDILETATPEQLDQALALMQSERASVVTQGIATPQLEARINVLSKKEPLLVKYRSVQTLHFTDLKAQILEKVPEKLEKASLKDLTSAFKTFHDAERDIEDPGHQIKGIVAYLLHIDKAEASGESPLNYGEVIDVTPEASPGSDRSNKTADGIRIPKL